MYSPDCWSSIVVRSQIKAEVKRLENLYKMNSIHGQSTIYSQHSPDNSGSPNKHNDTGYNSNTNRGYHAQLSTEAEVFSGKISIILSLTLTTSANKRAGIRHYYQTICPNRTISLMQSQICFVLKYECMPMISYFNKVTKYSSFRVHCHVIHDLDQINCWCKFNKFVVNTSKSQIIS